MTAQRKRRPTTPGEFIKEDILDEYDLSQADLAIKLNMSRRSINQLVNARRSVTAQTALKLSKLTGTSAEFWLNAQVKLDLWRELNSDGSNLDLIEPLR